MPKYELILDVKKRPGMIPPNIIVRVGDLGSQVISASIRSGGEPYEPACQTARLDLMKSDGKWARCAASIDGDNVTCTLPSQALSSAGRCKLAYFVFVSADGDVVESTEPILLDVLPAVDTSGDESTDYDSQIDALIKKWLDFTTKAENEFDSAQSERDEIFKNAEKSRAAAESERVKAESSRVSAESDRAKAESSRSNAESARASAESGRVSAESSRVSAESARVEAEKKRVSAESARASEEEKRVSAESLRASSEMSRVNAESARVASESERAASEIARKDSEQARGAAESTRSKNEESRISSETKRVSDEESRSNAERSRAAAESERIKAESARSSAESGRTSAESARASAESSRVEAEKKRVSAESARVSDDLDREARQAKNDADQAANNEAARNNQPYVCGNGEYDPDTLAPTISSPIAGRLYLVPMSAKSAALIESEDLAKAAAAGNTYVEWLYLNSKWEQVGVSQKQVTPITTSEIDSVSSGTSLEGESVLSLTGLSYLWARVKAAFAPLTHIHSASQITSGTISTDRMPTIPIAKGGTGATSASEARTALGITLANLGVTVSSSILNAFSGLAASVSELNYVKGVTSSIQTQLNGKAASSHTHSASQVTGLTASRALVSDASGHPAVSSVTSTELGYLDGVTSSIQTQLNDKAASSHTHASMVGASTSAAGSAGFVPAPGAGSATRYLRSDGSWQVPPDTTYSAATSSAAGLMSAADKSKLDGIATGANKYVLPTATASTRGGVLLSDSTSSTSAASSGTAATPKAVKAVADDLATLRDSVSHRVKVKTYSQVTNTTNWVTVASASEVAAAFGVETALLDTDFIFSVYNGDFTGAVVPVSAKLSSADGLKVISPTAALTRINVIVARV